MLDQKAKTIDEVRQMLTSTIVGGSGFDNVTVVNDPSSYMTSVSSATGLVWLPEVTVKRTEPVDHSLVQLQSKLQEREAKLARVEKAYLEELAKKDRDYKALETTAQAYKKELELKNILGAIEPAAQQLAMTDPKFVNLFSKEECSAFVMSVDIRKSTDLMLKAVRPRDYAIFIRSLCDKLRAVVLNHHGVFDKFTGDGILAFFPDFYSGEDAGYLVIRAAERCHEVFKDTYESHLDKFTTTRSDAGLGIGIDFGQVDLVTNLGGLTVVGPPVVYACRFSGAPPHTTLLNQQAYGCIFEKYSAYCTVERTTEEIKNEGMFYAYRVQLNDRPFCPKSPEWLHHP